jgi:hypothetical protein
LAGRETELDKDAGQIPTHGKMDPTPHQKAENGRRVEHPALRVIDPVKGF